MGTIRTNSQVYEAVQHAQDDYTLGGLRSKNITNSEVNDIENAIIADGQVDAGEAQLLEALKSKTSFTISDGKQSTHIAQPVLRFVTASAVAPLHEGRSMVERDGGYLSNIPDYIPRQSKGEGTDVMNEDSYANNTDARDAFDTARSRMLDVNNWSQYAATEAPISTLGGYNPAVPNFSLHRDAGTPNQADVGDVIKISAGGQDMYVRIDKIIDTPSEFAMQVRPSDANGNTNGATEHMYSAEATNTFRLTQHGNTVLNGFHGRNEVTNSGLQNWAADRGMAAGGRSFSWDVMGDAWRKSP